MQKYQFSDKQKKIKKLTTYYTINIFTIIIIYNNKHYRQIYCHFYFYNLSIRLRNSVILHHHLCNIF